jgi:hypothetical protein
MTDVTNFSVNIAKNGTSFLNTTSNSFSDTGYTLETDLYTVLSVTDMDTGITDTDSVNVTAEVQWTAYLLVLNGEIQAMSGLEQTSNSQFGLSGAIQSSAILKGAPTNQLTLNSQIWSTNGIQGILSQYFSLILNGAIQSQTGISQASSYHLTLSGSIQSSSKMRGMFGRSYAHPKTPYIFAPPPNLSTVPIPTPSSSSSINLLQTVYATAIAAVIIIGSVVVIRKRR